MIEDSKKSSLRLLNKFVSNCLASDSPGRMCANVIHVATNSCQGLKIADFLRERFSVALDLLPFVQLNWHRTYSENCTNKEQ